MKHFEIVLWILLALECAGSVASLRAAPPSSSPVRPPEPHLERVDPETAKDIQAQRAPFLGTSDRPASEWFALAKTYSAFGYFREAEAVYRHTATLAPDLKDLAFFWGLCLEQLGQMSDAREQFRNAQAIPSDDPMREVECWNHLGLNALRLEDSAEAIAAFSEIKDASAPAKYQLAKLYARSGDLERAVPMLEELRKQIGIANEPYMFRARLEQARGNAKLGGLYRSAAQRAPAQLVNSAHARFYARPLRGRFGAARLMAEAQEVFRGGKREAALELAYRARNADWTRETNLRIVWFAAELKRFDEALKALEAQLEREGRLPLLLQRRAELLELAGRPEDALADWRDVDRLRPSRVAHLALARACERRGDEDGARRHGARALFRDGLTHFRSNSLTLAKTSFMAATERDPKHADSWFYLGEIGRVTRRSNAARAAYARCLDLDPGHSGARAGLAQVNGR